MINMIVHISGIRSKLAADWPYQGIFPFTGSPRIDSKLTSTNRAGGWEHGIARSSSCSVPWR